MCSGGKVDLKGKHSKPYTLNLINKNIKNKHSSCLLLEIGVLCALFSVGDILGGIFSLKFRRFQANYPHSREN